MAFSRFYLCTVSALLSIIANGQSDGFGAAISRVWFLKSSDESTYNGKFQKNFELTAASTDPLIGIEIPVAKLALFINGLYKDDAPKVSYLSEKLVEAIKAAKGSALFSVQKNVFVLGRANPRKPNYQNHFEPFLTKDKETIVVVLPSRPKDRGSENDLSDNSINASYDVFFDLDEFCRFMDRPNIKGKSSIVHKGLALKGRGTLSVSTDFAEQDATLIGTSVTAPSTRTKVSFGYKGISNPLQGRLFRDERSYYDFSISGILTSNTRDTKSQIVVGFDGATNILPISGTVTTTSIRYETSQSVRQQSFIYDLGWKMGDNRANGIGFVPINEIDETFTLNFGIQLGYRTIRELSGVPSPDRSSQIMVRPRITLGIHDLFKSGDNSLLSLSGNLSLYAVSKGLGGADTFSGYGEEFDLAIKFGPETGQLVFSVSGGRNRSQDFVKVIPTYGLGISYKF